MVFDASVSAETLSVQPEITLTRFTHSLHTGDRLPPITNAHSAPFFPADINGKESWPLDQQEDCRVCGGRGAITEGLHLQQGTSYLILTSFLPRPDSLGHS